jgi:hydrogenase expression/formation protein HypD
MKYLSEYRDSRLIRAALNSIKARATRPWTIMEICGGQTHGIVKYGLDQALEGVLHLIHGPGCPVCVTPEHKIDAACAMALQHEVILCSYGDMLRVPGSRGDLLQAKAQGADVRLVREPKEALSLAQTHPDREVVFLAVGFETTAPIHAMLVHAAHTMQVKNFSLLLSHVLVPPALRFILEEQDCAVEGVLAAGHVCSVMGYEEYQALACEFKRPIVVTGFEALDILEGLLRCVERLEEGAFPVENQYQRVVTERGNHAAQAMVAEIFAVTDVTWRGLGVLPRSGLTLQPPYASFDAERRFPVQRMETLPSRCPAHEVLKGRLHPLQCPYFGKPCCPERPLGAPMVSAEGACMAYFQARETHEPGGCHG